MTTSQYIYATRKDDTDQHLLVARSGPAICGATADHWHCGEIGHHHFPGVPLCEECSLERQARKAEAKAAALRKQAADIKTFWTQERTP
jgi:hypothetical protein